MGLPGYGTGGPPGPASDNPVADVRGAEVAAGIVEAVTATGAEDLKESTEEFQITKLTHRLTVNTDLFQV